MTISNYHRHPEPNNRKLGCWLPLLLLIGFFIAFLMMLFSSGLFALTRYSIGESKSMEPYELEFKTSAKDVTPLEAESLPRREWILNLPRAFIASTIGRNGTYGPDDSNLATLMASYDPKTGTIAPLILAPNSRAEDKDIFIRLQNAGGHPQISQVNYCVRDDDYSKFMASFGIKVRDGKCDERTPMCSSRTHLDGWSVEITMPRSVYFSDPQPAFRAMKEFLNKHTVRRDKLR
jgi:hypothetical protein